MMPDEPMNNRDLEALRAKRREQHEAWLEQHEAWLKEMEATRTEIRKLDEKATKTKPKYSPEVIQRYREMQGRRAFRRQIKERVPVDLNTDDVTLSCGHKLETMISFINATDGQLHCRKCEKEWLVKAVEEEKKHWGGQSGSDK